MRDRFVNEKSLALYLGMAALDNSSDAYQGSKAPRNVNKRARAALVIAVDRHRKSVEQSKPTTKKTSRGQKTQSGHPRFRASYDPDDF